MCERLEGESEVEFPSPAFCQVESFPDNNLQIGPRDGNLQTHRFDGRAGIGGVLGGVRGVYFPRSLAFNCTIENSTKPARFVYGVNTPYRQQEFPAKIIQL